MSRLLDRRKARKVNVNGLRRDPRTGAGTLAKSERGYGGVLAFDFTDQSVAVYDPTTQANVSYGQGFTDGNGNLRGPARLLTYTSPSNKLVMQADGFIKYSAHNLCLQSEDVSNAAWGKTASTVSGDEITFDNTAAYHYVRQIGRFLSSSNSQYRFSCKLTPGTATYAVVSNWYDSNALEWVNVVVNFSAETATPGQGASGGGDGGTATLTNNGDGTFTLDWIFTQPSNSSSNNIGFSVTDDGTTGSYGLKSYAAGGVTYSVTEAHLHRYPAVTDYVKTTSAAVYSLPYEYDTAGACKGLLVEEARTNLCLYANDLTRSNWTKTNATTAFTATGPGGSSNSATTLTASSSNGTAVQRITSASASRSGGVHLKRRTGTGTVSISIGDITGSDLVDTANDAASWSSITGAHTITDDGASVKIECTSDGIPKLSLSLSGGLSTNLTVGNLYRVTLEARVDTGDAVTIGIVSVDASTNQEFTSVSNVSYQAFFVPTNTDPQIRCINMVAGEIIWIDSISVYACATTDVDLSGGGWVRGAVENKTITNPVMAVKIATSGDAVDVALAGVEDGAFVTSPIQTFGSTATRALDNITIATSAFPNSDATASLFASVGTTADGSDRYAAVVLQTTLLYYGLRVVTSNEVSLLARDGATRDVTTTGITFSATGDKLAGAVASNDLAVTTQGANVTTGNTYTPITAATLRIGGNSFASATVNGHIKAVSYVPRRKTNAELQAETA